MYLPVTRANVMKGIGRNIAISLATLGLLVGIALFAGCEDEKSTLAVGGTPVMLIGENVEGTFTIYTNTSWEALPVSGEDWLHIAPVKGTGETAIKVTADENPAKVSRSGTIRVRAGDKEQHVIIYQGAMVPTLKVSPASLTVGAAGEQRNVTVTTNLDWTATVNPEAPWCQLLSSASGSGNSILIVSAEPNMVEASRSATVTVSAVSEGLAERVVVTQAAFNPDFSVTPLEVNADVSGGQAYPIFVTTNLAWTAAVAAGDSWCRVSPQAGTGSTTLTVALDAAAESRSTRIVIAAGAYSETVTVSQNILPVIVDATKGFRCGAGTVTLTAAANESNVVDWYDQLVGGSRLLSGSNTYTVNATSSSTFYVEARNPQSGLVSASRVPIELELLPAFSAGEIKPFGERLLSGGTPTLITSIAHASGGGEGTILYEWRKNGTLLAGSNFTEYLPTLSEAAAAGVYTYTRYAKNESCKTDWLLSTGTWVMDVNQSLTTACATTPTTAGADYGAVTITCNGVALDVQKEDANGQQLVCWYPNNLCPPGWRWPTRTELACLYGQRTAIGNFSAADSYWTSEYHSTDRAWVFSFSGAGETFANQNTDRLVRCVK